MEDRQGIVRAEEEPPVDLRVLAQVKQHPQAIGQCQCRDVGIKVGVVFRKITQGRQKLFVEDQPVAAGMGCNDGGTFIQRRLEPIRIADRLVFADQAELVSDVTEERQLPIGESSVERFIAQIGRVELLRVWEDLHQ